MTAITTLYRNSKWTKRNGDTTNVVLCSAATPPAPHWVPAVGEIPADMEQLFVRWENGTRAAFYGYL